MLLTPNNDDTENPVTDYFNINQQLVYNSYVPIRTNIVWYIILLSCYIFSYSILFILHKHYLSYHSIYLSSYIVSFSVTLSFLSISTLDSIPSFFDPILIKFPTQAALTVATLIKVAVERWLGYDVLVW